MAILDDFVRFIDFQLTADSQVEVDFYEICLLCASVDEFFDNFMAGIELVENGQKGIVNPTWEQEPIASASDLPAPKNLRPASVARRR